MSSSGPPESSAPRIGSYQLLETVGTGASGVVYRARHAETGGLVALKRARALDAGELGSLRREVHALGSMRHDGVVRIVDHGVSDGIPWYAMELLVGETLRRRLDGAARAPSAGAQAELLRVVERLCDALAFLHGEGIVHRDLKPENVFIDAARGPVLVDFGLAMQVAGPLGR
ncbi:MAG TPA: serine/threonine-protein kinase, partial [Polyangia bacterium]